MAKLTLMPDKTIIILRLRFTSRSFRRASLAKPEFFLKNKIFFVCQTYNQTWL
jgi:hypothetical protein